MGDEVRERRCATGNVAADAAVKSQRWRTLTPLLYCFAASADRMWPSLTCRWGPPVSAANASAAGGARSRQRLYLSEQTVGSSPNTLIAAHVDVALPRCTSADAVARAWSDGNSSGVFRKGKTLFHPGEVNKIREVNGVAPAELVVTHSDCPEVFVWNLGAQPDRSGDGNKEPSVPNCLLVGHTANAEFALATAAASPAVASGGKDKTVCLWHLGDASSSLLQPTASDTAAAAGAPAGRTSINSGGLGGLGSLPPPAPKLDPRMRFTGHTDTVEDISFHPTSDEQLCSVGDDSSLCFWDARAGAVAVIKACLLPLLCAARLCRLTRSAASQVENAHGTADIHCCHWSRHDDALVLTGSADATVRLYDRRRASSNPAAASALVQTFAGHSAAVNVVEWCPDRSGVFASASEDGMVNVWDTARLGPTAAAASKGALPGLMFQHAGHAGCNVVDFNWSPAVPWTCVSVCEKPEGGGVIQLWRMSDLLYRPEAEVLAELEKHRESIMATKSPAAPAEGGEDGLDEPMDA